MKDGSIPEVTALHLAASMGLVTVAGMLLKEAPNIDAIDETGKTALTFAKERGFEKAVEFLLGGGALVNLLDDHGRTILLFIAERDWHHAGSILISKVQAETAKDPTTADPHLLFIIAAYLGNVDEVARLAKDGYIDVIDSGIDIGNLALFLAVEHQDGAMVDTLLHTGVNVNAKDSKGQTALFRATRRQDAVMVKLLIADKIEIDSRDDEGRTAWTANVKSRNKEILDLLLAAGADPSARALQGVSPLYEAAKEGETELVQFLLDSGTDPTSPTEYDWTPLHWAASYGHEDCVRLLINAGSRINVSSDQGVTPLDLAVQAKRTVIIDMLKRAGATSSDKLIHKGSESSWVRIGPPLATPCSIRLAPKLEHKLFLVFDSPLSRTLIRRTNFGQFCYPRVQQDSPTPAGYYYQASHVAETDSNTMSIRRPIRRAEMDEYPMRLDDFNFTNVLYKVTCLRSDYQEFHLEPGEQTTFYQKHNDSDEEDEDSTSLSFLTPPATCRMHKDWTGNWKVEMNSPTANELLFRTTPDWTAQSDSQDSRWVNESASLLARSGWDDATPNICFEPGVRIEIMDLLATCNYIKLWSETKILGFVEERRGSAGLE